MVIYYWAAAGSNRRSNLVFINHEDHEGHEVFLFYLKVFVLFVNFVVIIWTSLRIQLRIESA